MSPSERAFVGLDSLFSNSMSMMLRQLFELLLQLIGLQLTLDSFLLEDYEKS